MISSLLIIVSSCVPQAREVAPPPRELPLKALERPWNYMGEVLAVTKETITIRGMQQGSKGPEITRRFKACEHLVKGENHPLYRSNMNYRLADVKVGDIVLSLLEEEGEDDICLTVMIRRRPGGKVPPAPFEPADVPHKYHNDMNAYQANEELGVPLPLRLDPSYQRWLTDWTAWSYHESVKRRERTAPPPREVTRK